MFVSLPKRAARAYSGPSLELYVAWWDIPVWVVVQATQTSHHAS